MKYLALLRGINVGGNNKIEMQKLQKSFVDNGFKNVITYINSGNILFESNLKDRNKVQEIIHNFISKDFDLDIPVLVIEQKILATILNKIPEDWANDKEYKTDVMFLWPQIDSSEILNQIKINPDVDDVSYHQSAIVWRLAKKDYNSSKMSDLIKNPLYKKVTIRNINTVRKINEMIKTF